MNIRQPEQFLSRQFSLRLNLSFVNGLRGLDMRLALVLFIALNISFLRPTFAQEPAVGLETAESSTGDDVTITDFVPFPGLGTPTDDGKIFDTMAQCFQAQAKQSEEAWIKAGWERTDLATVPRVLQSVLPKYDKKQPSTDDLYNATLVIGAGGPVGGFYIGGAVVISPDGLALTNYHVATAINDKMIGMSTNGRIAKVVKLLAGDQASDVAIIQLEKGEYSWVPLASKAPQITDDIIALHHSENRFYTYDRGYVKRYPLIRNAPWMEISADYAPGGSGCGIFNTQHELVGLVSTIAIGDGPTLARRPVIETGPPENEPAGKEETGHQEETHSAPNNPADPNEPSAIRVGSLVVKLAVPWTAIDSLLVHPEVATEKPDQPALRIGVKAPELKDATWLQGDACEKFDQGKVYVVEVWATWCGPCIAAMPHLDELAKKYKDQGLEIVAMTTVDGANPTEAISKFVEDRGKEYTFGFAMCESDSLELAYMQAANRQSIPSSFVVDQSGKMAYIGHPKELDTVLEKIFNGTWKGEESVRQLKSVEERISSLVERSQSNPEAVLAEMEAMEKEFPHLAESLIFVVNQLTVLAQTEKSEELKAKFDAAVARSKDKEDAMILAAIGSVVSNPQSNPTRLYVEEGMAAVEAALVMNPTDPMVLIAAAESYVVNGQADKAIKLMDQSIEKTEDEQLVDLLTMLKARIVESARMAKEAEAAAPTDAQPPMAQTDSDLQVHLPADGQTSPAAEFTVALVRTNNSNEVELQIDAQVKDGWHIGSMVKDEESLGLPTKIEFEAAGLKPLEKRFRCSLQATDNADHESDQGHRSGSFRWSRKYYVEGDKPETALIGGKGWIQFQACSEKTCLKPNTLKFQLGSIPSTVIQEN